MKLFSPKAGKSLKMIDQFFSVGSIFYNLTFLEKKNRRASEGKLNWLLIGLSSFRVNLFHESDLKERPVAWEKVSAKEVMLCC